MKVMLSACVVLFVVLMSVPTQALEPLVLYDDFNAKLLNPQKWFGFGGGSGGLEFIRQIQFNRLQLLSRCYGRTDSDTGTRLCNPGLSFPQPALVTAIAATFQVNEVQATRCPTPGSAASDTRALLYGSFFNTATPTPGSSLNDVVAQIYIARSSNSTDSPNVLGVGAIVYQCASNCSTNTILGSKGLGASNVGERVKLRMQWDQDMHRFIFQRDDAPEVFIAYSVPDTAPPGAPGKFVQAASSVANCTATPRPSGFMSVYLDDVFVNVSAAPPPTGPPSVLTILPASGALLTTEGFDLSLVLEAPGRSITGGRATFDGADVTAALGGCVIPGTLLTGGQTFRCPGLRGLSPGTHIFDVVLNLSDGSSIRDTVFWEGLANTEP